MPYLDFAGTYQAKATIRVHYSEEYNPATNSANVKITSLQMYEQYHTLKWQIDGLIQINGQTVITCDMSKTQCTSSGAGTWLTISGYSGSGSAVIPYDSSGKASITITLLKNTARDFRYYRWWDGVDYYGGVESGTSQTAALSAPGSSTIGSISPTVQTLGALNIYMNRSSPNYYHKATFSSGGRTLGVSGAFGEMLSFTVPRSWFSYWTSSTSLSVTASVQTYIDQSCTAIAGPAASASFTVTADSGMKPEISGGFAEASAYNTGAVAGVRGYVAGYSMARISFDSSRVDMSATQGASIAGYKISCAGVTDSAEPYLTPVLSGDAEVVCTVTDSRGRSASQTLNIAVIPYAPPTLSRIAVFRCDAAGAESEDGTYYSVKATLGYSPLEGENDCVVTAAVRAGGGSYGEENDLVSGEALVLGGTLSPDLSYEVRISALDALGNSASHVVKLPTRKWALKFRPGGMGAAFGKAPEHDMSLELPEGWKIRIGSQTLPQPVLDLTYPVGSIYCSSSATSPAELFGGSWARIENRFLLAAGSSYSAGETGGEAAHKLTTDEMPSHSHSGSSGWTGAHTHTVLRLASGSGTWGTSPSGTNRALAEDAGMAIGIASSAGGHSHSVTVGSSGGSGAHNNMPPYLAVYVWERIE